MRKTQILRTAKDIRVHSQNPKPQNFPLQKNMYLGLNSNHTLKKKKLKNVIKKV